MNKTIIFIILAFAFATAAQAQDRTMYFMNRLSQATSQNPAFSPNCKVYVGFPGISSVGFSYASSGFALRDFASVKTERALDTTVYNLSNMVDAMADRNHLTLSQDWEMLSFGFQVESIGMYFGFSLSENYESTIGYDKSMFGLLTKGNAGYIGETARVGFDVKTLAYLDYAFSASKKIDDKLTVGATFSYLSGMAAVKTDNFNLGITTGNAQNMFATTVETNGNIYTTIPFDIDPVADYDEDGNLILDSVEVASDAGIGDYLKMGNHGFAMDFGATYQLTDELLLSASILDLGMISWKNNLTSFQAKGSAVWDGVTYDSFDDFVGDSDGSTDPGAEESTPMEDRLDSLVSGLGFTHNKDGFSTALSPKVLLGASYDINPYFNAGALFRSDFIQGKMYPSLTLAGNLNFLKMWSAHVSYSMMSRSYNNLGFGLNMRLTPFQLYFISDNINLGLGMKTVSFRCGLNITIGAHKKGGEPVAAPATEPLVPAEQ